MIRSLQAELEVEPKVCLHAQMAQHSLQNHLHEAFVRGHRLQITVADLEEEDVVSERGRPAREQVGVCC